MKDRSDDPSYHALHVFKGDQFQYEGSIRRPIAPRYMCSKVINSIDPTVVKAGSERLEDSVLVNYAASFDCY